MYSLTTNLPRRTPIRVGLFTTFAALSSCTVHCGPFTYCDIPESWPVADTFTVEATDSDLCISGVRRSDCATRGRFQSGSRVVEFHAFSDEEEDDSQLLATITLKGSAGDHFTANCFQYNGKTVLGLTEVLIGIDVYRQGRVVATHPKRTVTRRSTLFSGC